MPAPNVFSHGVPGASRRRRLAPLVAGGALLAIAGIAVSALMGSGGNAGNLGLGDLGLGDDGSSYEGDDTSAYATMPEETYEPYDEYEADTDTYDEYEADTDTYDEYESAPSSVPYDTGVAGGTTGGESVVLPSEDAWADGVEATFDAYFGGINGSDPQTAWMQLSASRQAQTSLDEFADAVRTSYDADFVVREAGYAGGRADVWLEFTSTQDPALGPNPGEGCTLWSLDYVLLEQPGGTFLIDEVAGHGGTAGHSPC